MYLIEKKLHELKIWAELNMIELQQISNSQHALRQTV